MRIEDGLYSYLSGYAGLTALVNKRIYPITMPMVCEKPAVTFQRISRPRVHTMGDDPGLVSTLFQIDCWAETPYGANDVAEQVITALKNQRNTTWGGVGGVTVQASIVENDEESFEPDTKLYRVMVEVVVWHLE